MSQLQNTEYAQSVMTKFQKSRAHTPGTNTTRSKFISTPQMRKLDADLESNASRALMDATLKSEQSKIAGSQKNQWLSPAAKRGGYSQKAMSYQAHSALSGRPSIIKAHGNTPIGRKTVCTAGNALGGKTPAGDKKLTFLTVNDNDQN